MDLDAPDSPFVRPAEEWEKENTKIRKVTSKKAPGISKMQEARKAKQKARLERKSFHKHCEIVNVALTPYDALSYAFMSPRRLKSPKHNHILRHLRNEGLHRGDSLRIIVERLLASIPDNTKKRIVVAAPIKDRITTCDNFEQLRRLVSLLCSSQRGCEFAAANGSAIAGSIYLCRAGAFVPGNPTLLRPHTVLNFLNNLRIRLERNGVQIGSDLCNAGLYYAAKSSELSAVRNYLEISLRNNYKANETTARAMLRLAMRLPRFGPANACISGSSQLIALLVGESNLPDHENKETPSFARLLEHEQNPQHLQALYSIYLNVLGSLERVDDIANELVSNQPRRIPQLYRENKWLRVQLTAIALLIANDPGRARLVLESAQDGYDRQDFTIVQEEDDKLLWAVPNSTVNTCQEALYKFMLQYYTINNVKPIGQLRIILWNALGQLPFEPADYLRTLSRFLLDGEMKMEHKKTAQLCWVEDGANGGAIAFDIPPAESARP